MKINITIDRLPLTPKQEWESRKNAKRYEPEHRVQIGFGNEFPTNGNIYRPDLMAYCGDTDGLYVLIRKMLIDATKEIESRMPKRLLDEARFEDIDMRGLRSDLLLSACDGAEAETFNQPRPSWGVKTIIQFVRNTVKSWSK